jgi:succinate dehydrogenase/fumarate reductase flavoprotein subunit
MMRFSEEKIETDVLVVGAGTGGMMAAIAAADGGAQVVLCEKGNAMRSGGIRGGNDHFLCYIPGIHTPAVWDNILHSSLTMSVGTADADVFVRLWERSYEVVKKWEDYGINMKTNGHYEFTGHSYPGSSGRMGEPGKTDRIWLHFSDLKLSTKLEKQVRDRNVKIMNRVMVTDLLKNSDGRVAGAIGISTREPKLYIFQAKSVIYNTGGVNPNRLYPTPFVMGYSLAEPETGDGDLLAYRGGADIMGAEFLNRHVSVVYGPFYGKASWIGVVRDANGNAIAPPYLSKPDLENGDMSAQNTEAMDRVWAMGKGPVWMDTRQATDEDMAYMRFGFDSEAMQPLMSWLEDEKIDIRKSRFEFAPTQPMIQMRTRVDTDCMTTVKGLFSTVRPILARNAISGMIAGEAAAKHASEVKSANLENNRGQIERAKEQYEIFLGREGSQYADWTEAQWAIWQIMHRYALPPLRTENTLKTGHARLLRLRDKAKQTLKAANPHELYHCLEVLNLMDIAELVILATIERKESRGEAHRLDYPFVNPMLAKILLAYQKDGKPAFKWDSPRPIPRKT